MKFNNMATSAFAIIKSDTTKFGDSIPLPDAGLYVGTTGHLTVTMADTGAAQVFKNVPSGTHLKIVVSQVLNATTASDIVGLYSY